ncbi:hypothetical protein HPB50_016511 [Hyalomma asiaticum]|uniref:Uncharacterized protein n=1 Tax=Hyalomma asiaticum TaxID=266040 RepID=A0ACB7SWW1_HYAAI|nr:hypothetical protein HPB50_016511 [Hyalomma asiaticum]
MAHARQREAELETVGATSDVFLALKIPRHISWAFVYLPTLDAVLQFLQNEATSLRVARAVITTVVVRQRTHAEKNPTRRTTGRAVGQEVTNLDPRCPFVTRAQWTGGGAASLQCHLPAALLGNKRRNACQDGVPVAHSSSAESLLQPRNRQPRHKQQLPIEASLWYQGGGSKPPSYI